jgi:hypothetical protein
MNCRSVFITSERSEGSAVCGELQIFRSVQHREVWQIERPTKSCHVRRWLFTATAIIIVMVSLPLAAQSLNKTAPVTKSSSPHIEDPQLYRDTTFGFRYQIPYGWVDRTQEMREGNTDDQSTLLLAVFERPPEATGDTINSAVVIASESAASYPGLKQAEDYVGPLTELATAK